MRGLIRILGFFMLVYLALSVVKVVGETFWPGKFKGRRKR
jgi:hypothetical protein